MTATPSNRGDRGTLSWIGRMASPQYLARSFCAPISATAVLLALALSAGAQAQVIEVGSDGQIATYSRPTVFTDAGAAPIQAPATVRAMSRAARAPAAEIARELNDAAAAYTMSPALVEAVARQESGLRHDAISRVGAAGVMQLMPGTARALGVDRFDLRQNIQGGTAYLSQLIRHFGGDLTLGLAAYNAGPAAVQRWGGVPPYAETQHYVAAIMNRLADQAGPAVR